jgi:DNA ligase-1
MSSAFPELYGASSHKKEKVWSVRVHDRGDNTAVVLTTHGYTDGKQVTAERVVVAGKNIGKSNATTPYTQALSEANALWNKKKDAGYTEKACGGACAGVKSEASTFTPPLPMLAHDFTKRGKSMPFPCFAQRKLDGVRCVAVPHRGLFSRNGKPLSVHLSHVLDDVNTMPADMVLDGELYSEELSFQEVVGLVKKKTLTGTDATKLAKIFLFVYDCIQPGTNAERNAVLSALLPTRSLHLLLTEVCVGKEDVQRLHAGYVAEGFEGLILRNPAAEYAAGQRSVHLQKYKEFEDAEFEVVGFKEGDGSERGCVIWTCRTEDGKEFSVRPRGTHDERSDAFRGAAGAVGARLTVRFQELTDDGIPRFPVGLGIRDYE